MTTWFQPPDSGTKLRQAWRTAVSLRGATIVVVGGCMRPFLVSGQSVWISPLDARPPEVGEVIYGVDSDSREIMHRVLARTRWRGQWRFIVGSDDGSRADLLDRGSIIGVLTDASLPPGNPVPYSVAWHQSHRVSCLLMKTALVALIVGCSRIGSSSYVQDLLLRAMSYLWRGLSKHSAARSPAHAGKNDSASRSEATTRSDTE